MPLEDVTGVILCGGEGRRMGGADKPLLEVDGAPLVAHLLARFDGTVGHWILSANRNLERYRGFGHVVVTDVFVNAGPLAGVHAAALVAATPWLFVCPGDAPATDPRLPAMLHRAAGDTSSAHAIDATGVQSLHMLVRTTVARDLDKVLALGACPVWRWLSSIGSKPIDASALCPDNLNTPADFEAWRRQRQGDQ